MKKALCLSLCLLPLFALADLVTIKISNSSDEPMMVETESGEKTDMTYGPITMEVPKGEKVRFISSETKWDSNGVDSWSEKIPLCTYWFTPKGDENHYRIIQNYLGLCINFDEKDEIIFHRKNLEPS